MTLSTAQLDELGKLLAAATQQPWSNDRPFTRVIDGGGPSCNMAIVEAEQSTDATLIVAAVNALPDLIATVRRLQSELAAKQAVIDKVHQLCLDYESGKVDTDAWDVVDRTRDLTSRTALAGQEQT